MNINQPFLSPWLAQLRVDRHRYELVLNRDCDVAVVGAGIAGVSTTYYLLTRTSAKVTLIDAGRVAHGATGRNAGHVVAEFERPLPDIARAFGMQMAAFGQAALESAWDLMADMRATARMKTPFYECPSYAGYSTLEQVVEQLETLAIRDQAGIAEQPLLIQVGCAELKKIPERLKKYTLEVPHSTILRAIESEDPVFIAASIERMGCTNSAAFCEELVAWMVEHYGDRLTVAEELPVQTITLGNKHAVLACSGRTITARRVVLCTNGFENFTIINNVGAPIDPGFHASIQGRIGYMAGYTDAKVEGPAGLCYFRKKQESGPYYYLTRRPYTSLEGEEQSLYCIGGPERMLPDRADYEPDRPIPAGLAENLDYEIRETFHDLPGSASLSFLWQGLMGYTRNNIRRVGFEPLNDTLLYNLGCNGVGIMPSVYGGKRIAQLVSGVQLPKSIFDPDLGHL